MKCYKIEVICVINYLVVFTLSPRKELTNKINLGARWATCWLCYAYLTTLNGVTKPLPLLQKVLPRSKTLSEEFINAEF